LDKLIGANKEVAEMQIQLKDLQPELEKSAIETEELMKQIEVEKKDAQETERIVSMEEN
jgi:dynein heavy chain